MTPFPADPHAGGQLVRAGAAPGRARAALVLLHGRGASAESILELFEAVAAPDLVCFAPQAAGHTWYPLRFLEPTDRNEPFLTSALAAVGRAVARAADEGLPPERVVLAGFSQGACLALEYAARTPRRWGGVAGLSGALIGPLETPRPEGPLLVGTPVFLGCADVDAHIPLEHVEATARALGRMGADVDLRLYPGIGHTVVDDEIEALRALVGRAAA